ncbi:MAG TPA: glycosyltransferase family 2 protein [Ignavibacteria bacterium]|nr:glycosyltransferase family 2 protein [Ignavibacteria bacterium]HRJ99483.1 glycosyltransferase family 2 protein [Ignavibacteria bacterium]HRK00071.1 glycosyltransferase family 2 protein [Ignavibacteria bacterium]
MINLFTAPFLTSEYTKKEYGLVSVLIPARNEEINIENCISSVMSQSYTNIEILVYDDSSSDNTPGIVTIISLRDSRVKLISGEPLPDGWLGKNHACWKLSQQSSGNYLLFIDSDVILEKDAVASAVSEINNNDSDLLSVFPKQIIKTFGENAVVPFMNWLLLSFLPVKLVSSPKFKSFAGANGQFILWKKDTYAKTGGHSAVKGEIVEDIETARFLKRNGYKILLLMSKDLVSCRMYSNFKEAVSGFSKNIYPASAMPAILFILNVLFLVISNIVPFILMFYFDYFIYVSLLILSERIVISYISSQNILVNILLHPLQMIMLLYISLKSVYQTKTGKSFWKDRKL